MINGKIHQGLLCVQAARPGLIGDITRRLRGKWKKEWNCVVADATSFNCARLIELSHQFGWIGTDPYAVARIERRGWPVIIKEPSLFKEIKDGIPGPDYIEKLGTEALTRTEAEFLKRPLWKYQRTAFYELHNLTGPILDMGMGPQPLTAKVMTPDGWTEIGQINVGDTVTGADGKPTTVIGVYDFGEEDVYEVVFSDESSTKCTMSHLWSVHTPKQKHRGSRPTVLTLEEIVSRGLKTSSGWWKSFVPMVSPVEFSQKTEPILDPYLVGVLIGDGCITDGTRFSTADVEIVEYIESVIPKNLTVKRVSEYYYAISQKDKPVVGGNEIRSALVELGLFGKKSEDKFIPTEYLLGSVECRIAILQGLLDTDGYGGVGQSGIEYSTSSRRLAEDFQFLVQSLGGTAKMAIKKTSCLDSYRFHVKLPRLIAPFRLKRRLDRVRINRFDPTRSIRKVRLYGKEKVRCIKVLNEDGLYVTDDFIVTHNTGKTTTAIALVASKKHEFGMIVCPKSVIDVWPLEFGKNYKKEIEIYTGTGKKSQSIAQYVAGMEKQIRVAQAYGRPFVFVCNYEAMWQGALAEFIAANKFDYIIFDEVHRIKAPTGTASKFTAKLRQKTDRIIGCTGTLLPHSPLDAFGSFRTIDPAVFGSNYIPFRNMFAEMGGFEGKQVKGYKNKEVMHKLISSVSFRITTEEALPHLPTKNHIVRKFKLDPKTEKLYNEMANELYAEIENCQITAANAMVKGLRLMQITSGVVKDTDGVMHRVSREKADLFEDIITDIGIREPLVVFCNFTADIEVVREVAEKTGRVVSELSGHKNELAQWQAGESDVLVVQIKAGKEGVDFTRACICMYYSIGHSLGDYEQSLFRVRRPGQERNVIYYHLVASGTIDEDVYDGLDKKRDIVLSILEGVTRRTATKKKKSIDKDAVDDVIRRMQEQITQGVPHGRPGEE